MAIASVIRDATITDLVFIAGVLSGFLVVGLYVESVNKGGASFCPI
jgi:hypothetical protein